MTVTYNTTYNNLHILHLCHEHLVFPKSAAFECSINSFWLKILNHFKILQLFSLNDLLHQVVSLQFALQFCIPQTKVQRKLLKTCNYCSCWFILDMLRLHTLLLDIVSLSLSLSRHLVSSGWMYSISSFLVRHRKQFRPSNKTHPKSVFHP